MLNHLAGYLTLCYLLIKDIKFKTEIVNTSDFILRTTLEVAS